MPEVAANDALGVVEALATAGCASARLTALPGGRKVGAHVHDHPYLSLQVLGSYREAGDVGEAAVDGPAAAFHPAGSSHEDAIGARGLATVIVEFDADWLKRSLGAFARLDRSRYWIGGDAGRRASRLARAWLGAAPAERCFAMTEAFLGETAHDDGLREGPAWLGEVSEDEDVNVLAARLGLSRPWLARAYRRHHGEGLEEARRRRRVETAVRLIETGPLGLAEIAAEAGFCDQSHMNRAFRLLLGRTPAAVRARKLGMAA
jgi:AraC family transcriptional regulator